MTTAWNGRQNGAAPSVTEDREYEIRGGIVFVGDAEVPLSGQRVLFSSRADGVSSLKLSILEADCELFNEAWQRMIHSGRPTAAGYPLSGLIPTAVAGVTPSWSPASQPGPSSGIGPGSDTVTGCEPDQGGGGSPEVYREAASILYSSGGRGIPIYAGAVYAQVVYANMLYTQVAYMQAAAPAAGCVDTNPSVISSTTLSIIGRGEDARRRVLAVEGIASVDLAASASCAGLADVLVRFTPGLPASRLVRMIQGI